MKSKIVCLINVLCLILFLTACTSSETIDIHSWKDNLQGVKTDAEIEVVDVSDLSKEADRIKDELNDAGMLLGKKKDAAFEEADKKGREVAFYIKNMAKDEFAGGEAEIAEIKADAALAFHSNRTQVSLLYVVDGDTIAVECEGQELRVRLIGVNTPESVHPDESKNSKEGSIASAFLKGFLLDTEMLYLEFDTETEDEYGRTLAYVWISADGKDVATDMLNGMLIKYGYAEVMTIEPNVKYKNDFEKLVK